MASANLCLSLTPESVEDVFAADIAGADCVEVRLDYLKNPQDALHTRWDRLPVPVIATCRGRQFGGRFSGSIEEEIRILESAASNGARYVDIDYRLAQPFGAAQVIASYHNFNETPRDLETIVAEADAGNAHITKVATQVNRWDDNRRLFALLEQPRSKPLIISGMGDLGQITRIAGPSRGSVMTYAASERQATAPGQLTIAEMLQVYKFRRIRKSTALLGIVGMPVGHSLSPLLHNRAFEFSNLDFAYVKLPAPDVGDFMDNARALGLHGFSVTIPHKVAVVPYMQRLAPAASDVGAVNTVSTDQGTWVGDNTDVYGVREALESAMFNPSGKRIVILGKGGGSRAAVAAVRDAREVVVVGRDQMAEAASMSCDLLINATPVGMYPYVDVSPVKGVINANAVFDMVYNPPITSLLRAAASQGKITIQGTTMLLAQAARQFEIWTGLPAPSEVFKPEAYPS